ncbi:MAG TPA: Uma2 family endonuclease, partial [Gemmataceae bacterium]
MSTAEALSAVPRLRETDPADYENYENYEIIDGQQVELPPMSADSQVLASLFAWHLNNYGFGNDVGLACTETLFKLPLKRDRNRRPDVAFVPFSRW